MKKYLSKGKRKSESPDPNARKNTNAPPPARSPKVASGQMTTKDFKKRNNTTPEQHKKSKGTFFSFAPKQASTHQTVATKKKTGSKSKMARKLSKRKMFGTKMISNISRNIALKSRMSNDRRMSAQTKPRSKENAESARTSRRSKEPVISIKWNKPLVLDTERVEAIVTSLLDEFKEKGLEDTLIDNWAKLEDAEGTIEQCTHFAKNMDKNQAEDVKCLDANRVKLERTDRDENDYIHASYVNVKNVPRKMILAQVPKSNCLEDFWIMVYQQNIRLMYLLCQADAPGFEVSSLFPLESGQHAYYGELWIHNRKVEKYDGTSEFLNDGYTIEVLPAGCAESVIVQINVCQYWPNEPVDVPEEGRVIRTAYGATEATEMETMAIVSKHGAGRAGTFAAVYSGIQMIKKYAHFTFKELFYSIRSQRPGSFDTEEQFIFAHIAILSFAYQNIEKKAVKTRLEGMLSGLRENLKIIEDSSTSTAGGEAFSRN